MERRGPRLTEQVLEKLRAEIIRGVLAPGAPVIEADVSERLRVSRTPVREALIQLAEDGLVEVYPQRGSYVAPIQFDAVREAQFVREHLECALLAEAAQRLTREWELRLSDNIDMQKRAVERGDSEQCYNLDEGFHAMIAEIVGNSRVWRVILQAKVHIDRIRYLSYFDRAHVVRMIGQHQAVMEALLARDAEGAVNMMRTHLREVLITMEHLKLRGGALDGAPPSRPAGAATSRRRGGPVAALPTASAG